MSWRHLTLKDISKVIAGQSPEGKYYNNDGIGLPFYQGKKNFTEKYLGKPEKWTKKVTKEAFEDDILISVRAPVGPVNIATEKVCIGRGLAAIRVNKDIDLDYVFNYLILNESKIKGNEGAVFNSINKNQIESIPIPIPSLSEQKQIVETLDKAFEKIDKAIANIERNIENAEELFKSKLNELFSITHEGFDKTWDNIPFEKLVYSTQIGLVRNAKAQSPDFPIRYFKMNNIRNNNGINETNFTNVNASEDELKKYSVMDGDFLFNTRNSHDLVGKSCVYHSSYNEPVVFNNNILRVRFKDFVLSDFVFYAFCSKRVKINLDKLKQGTTNVIGIYYKSLKSLLLPVPSVSEQKNVIKALDDLNKKIETLKINYNKELKNLLDLKKSILEKAFKGELTSAA